MRLYFLFHMLPLVSQETASGQQVSQQVAVLHAILLGASHVALLAVLRYFCLTKTATR